VCQPETTLDDDNIGDWEGVVGTMKSQMKKTRNQLLDTVGKVQDTIEEEIVEKFNSRFLSIEMTLQKILENQEASKSDVDATETNVDDD
jgi:hypothetical protein